MRAILTILPRPDSREVEGEHRSPSKSESTALQPADSSPSGALESVLVEKLLAELDARSAARFAGPYFMERPPVRRHVIWLRILGAALWVMSLVLCVFVVKYFDRQPAPQAFDPAQAQSIHHLANSIGDQNQQFSRMIDSVQTLADAVAAASARTSAMQAALSRLGHDLTPVPSALPQPQAALTQVVPTQAVPIVGPATVLLPQPAIAPPTTPLSMGGHRHDPVEDVIAPRNAIVHHNESGAMDYWLMPRIISGFRTMVKVFPIAQTSLGIFVHCFDEVRDYVVTPSGDWLNASDPSGNS
ncbi:MAG TPA: hypothetical protein VH369_05945 [Bryobacteraceae bacterium]|jgi:hypothetical protein